MSKRRLEVEPQKQAKLGIPNKQIKSNRIKSKCRLLLTFLFGPALVVGGPGERFFVSALTGDVVVEWRPGVWVATSATFGAKAQALARVGSSAMPAGRATALAWNTFGSAGVAQTG